MKLYVKDGAVIATHDDGQDVPASAYGDGVTILPYPGSRVFEPGEAAPVLTDAEIAAGIVLSPTYFKMALILAGVAADRAALDALVDQKIADSTRLDAAEKVQAGIQWHSASEFHRADASKAILEDLAIELGIGQAGLVDPTEAERLAAASAALDLLFRQTAGV